MTAGSRDSGVTSASGIGCSHAIWEPRRGQRATGSLAGPAEAGGQRTPAAALQRGQAGVRRDLVEPGPHRRPALEPAVGSPRPQVRLLDEVLGVVHRAEHPVAVRQQLAPERLGPTGELGPYPA